MAARALWGKRGGHKGPEWVLIGWDFLGRMQMTLEDTGWCFSIVA